MALAAALRRQHEQVRVSQRVGGMDYLCTRLKLGEVMSLAASSSNQHTSVAVPVQHSIILTTPPRNSGSGIFGSPSMLSSVSELIIAGARRI